MILNTGIYLACVYKYFKKHINYRLSELSD